MDPKTRITSAKAMEDEYFQDKVDGLPQGSRNNFFFRSNSAICFRGRFWR